MRRLVAMGLVAAGLALGACGDDSEETTEGSGAELASSAPEPVEPLDDAVAELNQAIADNDCELITELTFSTLRSNASGDGPAEPGEPVRPDECAKGTPAPALLAEIEGTTFDESEEYGSAAISQGSGGKQVGGYDMWAVIWLVDRDGQWRQTSFFPTDPQFDEDLPETVDVEAVTEQLVEAIETGDCGDAEQFMGDKLRFGDTPEAACEGLAAGSIFAPAVKTADEVTVEALGQARDYAVVGIDTGDTYFAAQLATPPIKPGQPVQDEILVIDVLPQTEFEIVEPEKEK